MKPPNLQYNSMKPTILSPTSVSLIVFTVNVSIVHENEPTISSKSLKGVQNLTVELNGSAVNFK